MRLILFGRFLFGKMWKNMEKQLFFRAATAGLGTYHTGSYGRIGVYRVKDKYLSLGYVSYYLLYDSIIIICQG